MKKHFVQFFSPGTFMAESTTQPIDSWDIERAQEMAGKITERYNAKPYSFRFITRARSDDELDSKVVKASCTYFINCKVETLAEIEKRNLDDEEILRRNMRMNGWDKVAVQKSGWRFPQPVMDGDVVL